MGEIKFTNGIVMAGVFSICIIMFAIGFAFDNDSSISLADDSDFSSMNSSIQSDLVVFNSSVDSAGQSFANDNVQLSTDTATSGGQFKNPGANAWKIVGNTLTKPFNKIFGGDPQFEFISIALLSVLALMMIRYLYKTWFGKDPD